MGIIVTSDKRIILPGDPRAEGWGFTRERWEGSYLFADEGRILCSALHARPEGAGHFRTLLKGMEASGHRVAVPCPMPKMVAILQHCCPIQMTQHTYEECDVRAMMRRDYVMVE